MAYRYIEDLDCIPPSSINKEETYQYWGRTGDSPKVVTTGELRQYTNTLGIEMWIHLHEDGTKGRITEFLDQYGISWGLRYIV